MTQPEPAQLDMLPRVAWLPRSAWPLIAGAAALALYLSSRSISLDDFDSYSFVLALRQFDLALQQPQPPGFPVYIALGRLLNLALPDPRVALTTLAALGGAASVAVVCWLGQTIFRRNGVALLGALLFAVFPIQWLTASKALSDAPGLAFSLGTLALLWAGRADRRHFVAGAALLGLSLGVRPQSNLPALLLLGWAAWCYIQRRDWRALALAAGAGLAAVLAWLIPVTLSAGGLRPYLDLLAAHSEHVWRSDSLFGAGPVTLTALQGRALDLAHTLLLPTAGVDVYARLGAGDIVRISALAAFFAGGLALADWRRRETWLLAIWTLVILLPLALFESLNRERLALPLVPPLLLLAVGGWLRLSRQGVGAHARGWVVKLAVMAMLAQGAPLAQTLAAVPAPPAQAADFLRAHYPPGETLIAAAGSYRAAQVELPGYRLLYRYEWNAGAAREAAASGRYAHIAILDREVFGDVIADLDGGGRYVPVVDRSFERDPGVHWQHSQVRLQVLAPLDALRPADLALPPGGLIDLGAPDDGRYLGQGWFRGEEVGGASARWAGDGLVSALRVSLPPGEGYAVAFRAAAFPPEQAVSVRVNGHTVARLPLAADWAEYAFAIDPALLAEDAIATVELVHAQAVSAREQSGGINPDERPLAAAYDWFRFDPR